MQKFKSKLALAVTALAIGLTSLVPMQANALVIGLMTGCLPVTITGGVFILGAGGTGNGYAALVAVGIGIILDDKTTVNYQLSNEELHDVAVAQGYSEDWAHKFSQDIAVMKKYITHSHQIAVDLKPLQAFDDVNSVEYQNELNRLALQGAILVNKEIAGKKVQPVSTETMKFLFGLSDVAQ